MSRAIVLILLFVHNLSPVYCQARIRIFSDNDTEFAVIGIVSGEYSIDTGSGNILSIFEGELAAVVKNNNKLALKIEGKKGFTCDSLYFISASEDARISVSAGRQDRRYYSGDIECRADMGKLLLINHSPIEAYIAGVVSAEGGTGRHIEFYKTQAVIARTYLYRYSGKHVADGYNLCDGTHCQVFRGITSDPVIIAAASETHGEIITGPDSLPVIAAFHSNCGGQTAASGDVWLTGLPYLKSVIDPWCTESRNGKWTESIPMDEWEKWLRKKGLNGSPAGQLLNFSQQTRKTEIREGNLVISLRQMRDELGLRSAFFSYTAKGDSIVFGGRGYGHGVGLCQEGAMNMALNGFNYREIIDFYYSVVKITSMGNVWPPPGGE